MAEAAVEGLALLAVALGIAGWIGSVVGPRWLATCGLLGFAVGVVAWSCRTGRTHRMASRLPASAKVILGRASLVMGCVAVAMLIVMLISTRGDGLADYPALAPLSRYELDSHGSHTVVSRARYIIASLSFGTGWHACILAGSLDALYVRLFGKHPW